MVLKHCHYHGFCSGLVAKSCPTHETPWTVACQALLSMGFSRQEHWSGLPCPSPGALPNPGIKPMPLKSPALAGGFFTTSATWENQVVNYGLCKHYKTMEY